MDCHHSDLERLLDAYQEQSRLLNEVRTLLASPAIWVETTQARGPRIEQFKSLTARLLKLQGAIQELGRTWRQADMRLPGSLQQAERARQQALDLTIDAIQRAASQAELSKASLLQRLGATNHTQEMLSAYHRR